MIGDRDGASYDGYYQRLIEGQIGPGDFSSWRNFLYAGGSATQLSIRTHGGSQAFANPTFTPLPLPNGEPGVVVTQFVPSSAAAPGEAGELVYYRPAGPAARRRRSRRPETSRARTPPATTTRHPSCWSQDAPTKVLTLGDNQYEHGELVNFEKYYASDWGRVRAITMPTPGNHDPPSSGYAAYFGKPPNYSFDLGAWHLIALDSTGIAAATRVPRLRPGTVRGTALHPRPTGTTRASRRTPRTATTPRSGRSGPGWRRPEPMWS